MQTKDVMFSFRSIPVLPTEHAQNLIYRRLIATNGRQHALTLVYLLILEHLVVNTFSNFILKLHTIFVSKIHTVPFILSLCYAPLPR
jgi:hypothetical protein